MRSPLLLALLWGCGASDGDLPNALPFEFERGAVGEPLTEAEVDAFSRRVTRFYRTSDYFGWLLDISHGHHASTGAEDFAVFWHNVSAVKSGETVTYVHDESGGAHNIYIPTPRVLQQAAATYLLTEREDAAELVEQYSKGMTAAARGMVYDDQDTARFLMARNVITQNHSYEIRGGRKKAVDYAGWYSTYERWNAHRINFENNPTWGDVWVTNMRSKDDVPHIFSAAPYLAYVVERAPAGDTRDAAQEALDTIRGFAKDIVDHGYLIRTKDADGNVWIPDQDLASFVTYESIIEGAECTAKLTASLIATGESGSNDCGRAETNDYEAIAVAGHFYNYKIVDNFHLSAVQTSLLEGQDEAAIRLLRGLAMRVDRYQDPDSDEPGLERPEWPGDVAVYLLQAAAAGLPLTAAETRTVQAEYGRALDAYEAFENWDLWAATVPDGTYGPDGGYKPANVAIDIEDMAWFMAYCFSPLRNEKTAPLIDCKLIETPDRW